MPTIKIKIQRVGALFVLASAFAACGAPDEPTEPVTRARSSLTSGNGSCFAASLNSCGMQSPDACWCDSACASYGDCCADKAATCDTATNYLGNYPYARANFWSEESQGVSHDATSWYLSQNAPQPRVLKVPITYDLSAGSAPPNPPIATIPGSLQPVWEYVDMGDGGGWYQVKTPGYQHVGDPDIYKGYLFVPLAGIDAPAYGLPAPPPAIAAYRVADMSFATFTPICGLTPSADSRQQLTASGGGGGWVTVDKDRGRLYASDGRIGVAAGGLPDQPIQVCAIDDTVLAREDQHQAATGTFPRPTDIVITGGWGTHEWLPYVGHMALRDQYANPMDLRSMQGGDLSDDGNFLYLSNGYGGVHSGNEWGLRIFDISAHGVTGELVKTSNNGFNPFNFQWCDDWTLFDECEQEPEGVDYGAVWGAPNISSVAPLHVVLLANGLTEDIIYFKHYDTQKSAVDAQSRRLFDSGSDAAISSRGNGVIDVFGVSGGGLIYQTTLSRPGEWTAWTQLPAMPSPHHFVGKPAAVSWSSGRIDVVAHDELGNVKRLAWNNGVWGTTWDAVASGNSAGNSAANDYYKGLSIASWSANHLDVFDIVRNASGGPTIAQITWGNGVWGSPRHPFGEYPPATQAVAAVSWGPSRIDLVATSQQVGSEYHPVQYFTNDGINWSGPWDLGAVGADFIHPWNVAISSSGVNVLDIIVMGASTGLGPRGIGRRSFRPSGWQSWVTTRLPKGLVPAQDGPVSSVSTGAGRFDVVYVRPSVTAYPMLGISHAWFNESTTPQGWFGSENL
jgi:hypothetical protein